MPAGSYDEALELLGRALAFGINPSLEGVQALVEQLGRPQDSFASVQVAGTNGKTSTARITEALLRAEGRRTALYTSPELERYPERTEIAGKVVSDERFAQAVFAAVEAGERLRPGSLGTAEGFTEFELLTAGALWLFREEAVDVAVLEVGLGGRWDATSVVSPSVAVITGIGLDHMHILGDTLEKIAEEKAAIIKPASAPVLGPGTEGLEHILLGRAECCDTHARAVRAVDAPTPVAEELTVRYRLRARPGSLAGATLVDVRGIHGDYPALAIGAPAYQAENVATAIAAAEAALGRELDLTAARRALADVRLPGRFELVGANPPLVVDGSHNPQAAAVLAGAVADAWPQPGRRPVVLLGVLADKDARGIAEALAPVASRFAVTRPDSQRALPATELARIVEEVTGAAPATYETLPDALGSLVGSSAGGLVVTGSLTTAGQARAWLRGHRQRHGE